MTLEAALCERWAQKKGSAECDEGDDFSDKYHVSTPIAERDNLKRNAKNSSEEKEVRAVLAAA